MENIQTPPKAKSRISADLYRSHARKLSRRHKGFKQLVKSIGPLKIKVPIWQSIDSAMLYSVIGQMLSASASASILKRLYSRYNTPKKIIEWAHRTRNVQGALCGVSQRKRKALSEWLIYKKGNKKRWLEWRDSYPDMYRQDITRIWGFGNWSADMIGIFYLGRMDIWPKSDAGLLRACRQVINTDNQQVIMRLVKDCETTAALYLWEYLDNKIKLT